MLAHQGVVLHRAQPPCRRDGFPGRHPAGLPGYDARFPKSAATLPRLLRDAGYSTMAVGKWHLTPRWQRSAAGPFDTWPLGLGFERYYGFLQGDTNHWAPNLVCDNHYIEPPRRPEEGYHLSEDLADQAVRMVQDQQQGAPGKPFFLYFALGAMHAPHHVTPEWVDPYRGLFDKGWDAWRDELFARQVATGMVPEGTVLTERPEWVQAWADLPAEERRMFARQQEVFAGFLTHTDAQIGRVLSSLESLGVLDNTLVMVFSDNGASAEGGVAGSFNEHRFTAHLRESMDDNLAHYDDWGGFTHLQPLLVGLGLGGQHAAQALEALHLARRDPHPADRALARPHCRAGHGAHPVRPCHRPHADDPGCRRPRRPGPGRRRHPAAAGRGEPAPHARRPGDARAPRHPVLRDDGLALHLPRGLEGHDEPHQHGHPRRGGTCRREPRLRRRSLGALRPVDGLLRGDRPRRGRAGTDAAHARAMGRRGPAQQRPAHFGRPRRPLRRIHPAGLARRTLARTFRPGGGPVADESVPMLWGGFDITADIDTDRDAADGVVFALGDWFGGYALYLVEGRVHFTFARAADALELMMPAGLAAGRHDITVSYAVGQGDPAWAAWSCQWTGSRSTRPAVEGMLPLAVQHGGAGLRLGLGQRLPGVRGATRPRPPSRARSTASRVDTPGSLRPDPVDEVRAALHAD